MHDCSRVYISLIILVVFTDRDCDFDNEFNEHFFLKWFRFHLITIRRFSFLSSFRFFLIKYNLWKKFIIMSKNLNQHFSFVWMKEWQLKYFLKNLSSDWCLSLNVLLRLDDRFRLSNWDDLTSNVLALMLFFFEIDVIE
jgi:hypothetical protein